MPARAAAVAAILLFVGASAAPAAPLDDFAAACMQRGVRESACNCQARLARGALDARERRAALAAMTGGQDAMMKEVAAMGDAKAQAFAGKMRSLGERARKECA